MKQARMSKAKRDEKEAHRGATFDKIRQFSLAEADRFLADVLWMTIEIKKAEKALRDRLLNDLNAGKTQPIAIFSEDVFIDRSELGLTPEQAAEEMIKPLAGSLKSLAERMFLNVLGDVMCDAESRNLFLKEMSALLGKKGGRPLGVRTKHIVWLEEMLASSERFNRDNLAVVSG